MYIQMIFSECSCATSAQTSFRTLLSTQQDTLCLFNQGPPHPGKAKMNLLYGFLYSGYFI